MKKCKKMRESFVYSSNVADALHFMINLFKQEIECPAGQYVVGSLGPDPLIMRSGRLEPVREDCRQFFADHQRSPCELDVGI